MRLLLDTHIALWWQLPSDRLTPVIEAAVLQAEAVYVSRASLWELAIKRAAGKLDLDLTHFCRRVEEDGFEWLAISEAHLVTLSKMPLNDDHKDPFDRLLVAQSLSEPLMLLTVDRKLAQYGNTVRVL